MMETRSYAVWGMEYDMHTDSLYRTPACPICEKEYGTVPVYRPKGKHKVAICVNCHKMFYLDKEMIKWMNDNTGTKKVSGEICIACGQPAMESIYRKNPVNGHYVASGGHCKNCGAHYIV